MVIGTGALAKPDFSRVTRNRKLWRDMIGYVLRGGSTGKQDLDDEKENDYCCDFKYISVYFFKLSKENIKNDPKHLGIHYIFSRL